MGDIVVGVYYKPSQEEKFDKAFYRQLKVTSQSQALVLRRNMNQPDICWKTYTAQEIPAEH